MSFAAAAFLAGLAALVVPWWLHRRETERPERHVVSSLLLMRPGDAPEQMQRTLRHRWLLALRLLLLAVLVLAFAQPVLERVPGSVPAAAVPPRLVALDTSMSMAAAFGAARRAAHRILDAMPPGARAAVVGAADRVTVETPMTADAGALHDAVDALRPGPGRLSFDGLAGRLAGVAATLVDGPVEVHLISDFQQSAMPAQFNALVAGAAGPVALHPLSADGGNWLIERVTVDGRVNVGVRGIGTPARALTVVLEDAGGERGRQVVAVPEHGRAVAAFPLPDGGPGDHWLRAGIDTGDVLAADDARYYVVRRDGPVSLPMFAPPGAAAELDYLKAAVGAATRFVPAGTDQSGPVAVIVDAGEPPADQLRRLERHLAGGGGLLMTVGPATRRAGRLPLLDLPLAGRFGEEAADMRRVSVVDAHHPALVHADAWRSVTVTRALAAADARGSVLLALDDGRPLLVEHRVGAGRVLVLMTALTPAWSDLVTTPAFVSFVADALGYLAEDTLPTEAVAGRPLAIAATNVQLFDRFGRRMLALGETVGRPDVSLEEPGIYTLRTPSRERLLAVNTDVRESDLTPADPALLERWQAASVSAARSADRSARDAAPPAVPGSAAETLPLAPWLLGLLAVLALLEPIVANLVTAVFRTRSPT